MLIFTTKMEMKINKTLNTYNEIYSGNTKIFTSVQELKETSTFFKYQITNWYEYTTYKYESIIHLF